MDRACAPQHETNMSAVTRWRSVSVDASVAQVTARVGQGSPGYAVARMAVAVTLPSALVAPITVTFSPVVRSPTASVFCVVTWVVDDSVTVIVDPSDFERVKVVPSSEATVPLVGGEPARPVPPEPAALLGVAPVPLAAVGRWPPLAPKPVGAVTPVSLTRVAVIVVPAVVPLTLT